MESETLVKAVQLSDRIRIAENKLNKIDEVIKRFGEALEPYDQGSNYGNLVVLDSYDFELEKDEVGDLLTKIKKRITQQLLDAKENFKNF